jgi:PHP family Zn ribbon phosphoesterase
MPPFYADLHIHSKHSRACSQDLDIPGIAAGARASPSSVIDCTAADPLRDLR